MPPIYYFWSISPFSPLYLPFYLLPRIASQTKCLEYGGWAELCTVLIKRGFYEIVLYNIVGNIHFNQMTNIEQIDYEKVAISNYY